jgi:hypothetical protein
VNDASLLHDKLTAINETLESLLPSSTRLVTCPASGYRAMHATVMKEGGEALVSQCEYLLTALSVLKAILYKFVIHSDGDGGLISGLKSWSVAIDATVRRGGEW